MRVAIAGAGNVGRAIARELLSNGHQILLIDKDPKAMKMESVPTAEWLLADSCEISSLDTARLDTCHVLVAATGDDKVNLVTSLLAKTEYGVPRVVARVNHPKNEWMFDSSWGVDVAVSTPRIITALVEEAVSVGDVVRLFSLQAGSANLVELTLPDNSPCCGKTINEVTLPGDVALVAILRDGHVIKPLDHDIFSAGDELIFIASESSERLLKACFVSV
jgi:trk system potassium uptake protein TrkA